MNSDNVERAQSRLTSIDPHYGIIWTDSMARPLRYEAAGAVYEGGVTRAIRRVNENPTRKINLEKLEAMLVSRD
jgi:hypothetical protein